MNYESVINQWRAEQETKLRSETGWLTLVGLSWLREGVNAVGSDPKGAIVLPKSVSPKLGEISFTKGAYFLRVTDVSATDVKVAGKPVKVGVATELKSDADGKATPTEVTTGSVTFFLIQRAKKMGVRVRDTQADTRLHFTGRKWFEPDRGMVVRAKWIPHTTPMKLLVPDVIGNQNHEDSPGHAEFQLEGQTVQLYPTVEDGMLFFVFRDKTSGKETYGASRFLHAEMPVKGLVLLDFNKAVNPPCAFTHYATCPLPPPENVLKVRVAAGELRPEGH